MSLEETIRALVLSLSLSLSRDRAPSSFAFSADTLLPGDNPERRRVFSWKKGGSEMPKDFLILPVSREMRSYKSRVLLAKRANAHLKQPRGLIFIFRARRTRKVHREREADIKIQLITQTREEEEHGM